MAATMHDVARLAGVSIKTVSNVVNGHPHVRDETRERVRAAVAALDYQVNVAARNLRTGRTGVIGLAVPELGVPYFAELADAVIAAAGTRGLTVLIELHGGERDREVQVLSGARRHLTDGLIFSPLALGAGDEALVDTGHPIVLLGERMFDHAVDHVTMQNVEAARAAMEHLLRSGRRRVAVIGVHPGEVLGSAGLRLEGCGAALKGAGLPLEPALLGTSWQWTRAGGARAMAAMLDSGVLPDAVFGLNDALALGAMHELQVRGLRVPQDVAVMGFDDIDEGAYANPALTTVDPGRGEIAETAVQLLVDQIARVPVSATEPRPAARRIYADFRVLVRDST